MKFSLKKSGHDQLVVFFSGWGMDENQPGILKSIKFDILTVYDYRDPKLPEITDILNSYKSCYLIAWSMGVWASTLLPKTIQSRFLKRIAVNGTLKPIDDEMGISKNLFSNTLKNMSIENRDLFYSNMFLTSEDFSFFKRNAPKREFSSQLEELEILGKNISGAEPENLFDVAFVGKKDKIFTFKNQIRYWKQKNIVKIIDAPHFPFNIWSSWDEIIEAL